MLETFISQEVGKIVSFDNVPANAGQSVQLVAKWCQFIGLPFQWANAGDWWDGFDENFLEYWNKIELKEGMALNAIHPGDIIIFNSLLPGSGGMGHASIFVRLLDKDSWEGFDANWGGKSAHLVCHNWVYVQGWYTPKNPSVVEASIPTSIADEAPGEPYDAEIIETKIIYLKQSSALYNLRDVNWDSFNQNLISHALVGTKLVVTAICKHRLGGIYYMPDIERPEGYRKEDCEDSVQQATVSLRRGPHMIPSPIELATRRTIMAPPLTAPSTTDVIRISFSIPKYSTMSDALRGVNSKGELRTDRYYIYKRLNGMISITSQLGKSMGIWINPADFTPKAAIEPKVILIKKASEPNWHTTYRPFQDEHGIIAPRYFIALADDKVTDFEHGHEAYILQRQPVLITGWFTGPDGNEYGRPHDASVRFLWYGVRRDNLRSEQEETSTLKEERPFPMLSSIRGKIASVLQNPTKIFDIIKSKQH